MVAEILAQNSEQVLASLVLYLPLEEKPRPRYSVRMFIYCVRHGQTPGNAEKRHQTPDTPLSLVGEEQAAKVAERLADIAFHEIWTSPYTRARQTADIINSYHHLPIHVVPALAELRRGPALEGKLYNDPSIQHLNEELTLHADDPTFKLPGSESTADFAGRLGDVVQALEVHAANQSEDAHLCVVAHGISLSTLIARILLGRHATPTILHDMVRRTWLDNTGVSILNYHENTWRVLTVNDQRHL